MALKLRVQESKVRLKVSSDAYTLSATVGRPIYPEPYTGSYEVTPSSDAQTIHVDHLMMAQDLTINPIPNNYGLITWNGTGLRIS